MGSWAQVLRIINGVLDVAEARVTNMADGTEPGDAVTVRQVEARTPRITVSSTPPSSPDTNDLWIVV